MNDLLRQTREYDIADAERLNPTRSPRWRYERIRQLLDGRKRKRPSSRRDDEIIRHAYSFFYQWERATDLGDEEEIYETRLRLFPRFPGLYYAYQLFSQPDCNEARIALEARLLARQDDEKIANSLDLIPETLPWYEAMFFNVRDRLDKPDYIVRTVLGPMIGIGLRNATEEMSCKYWCYFGPEFADEIITGMEDDDMPSLEWWLEKGKAMLVRRYSMSFPFFGIDRWNLPDVLKGFTEMVALHEKALAEAGAKTTMEENVTALVGALSWTIGQRQRKLVTEGTALEQFVGKAVEPRAAEQFALTGGTVPARLEADRNKTLPPPRSKEDEEAK